MTGSAHVLRANARDLPLPDSSVDLVVTSPPYFALRSYQDGGEHYSGQVGDEATPAAFVDSLIDVTGECVRVLKPSGSLWVNLGDKYSGAQAQNIGGVNRAGNSARTWAQTDPKRTGIPNKSLCGIPWRYALRCIDDLGLILRAEVIWSKPNGLPESVTDRVRRSHEQWFHFVLNPRYFSAVDEIRTEHKSEPGREGKGALGGQKSLRPVGPGSGTYNPLGALPGSVWTVPTEPLTVPAHLGVDHFAAFPTEWPRRIIQGWSPAGVCTACGEGRRPVRSEGVRVGVTTMSQASTQLRGGAVTGGGYALPGGETWQRTDYTITGYACACTDTDAPTTPAVVLDPFGGTGTTAIVAKALGRTGITVDMSADYCRLATWRCNNPQELAKAARVVRSDAARAQDGLDMDPLFDMEEPA